MTTTPSSRLRAQLLAGPPASSPEEVVGHLLAVQSQDIRGSRFAVRARSCGLTSRHVDKAMTTARSLVVTWLNRGTLHLVKAADYWWLAGLTSPLLAAGNTRRLIQEGLEPLEAGRGVAVILQAIADRGPLTRAELRAALVAAVVRTAGPRGRGRHPALLWTAVATSRGP